MSEASDEERGFREQTGREAAQMAFENLDFLHDTGVFGKLEEVFKVNFLDENTKKIVRFMPPEYELIFKVAQLVDNLPVRTGNITVKEEEMFEIDLEIAFLEIEMLVGNMPSWMEALKIFLHMALKDAIEAHRMKAYSIHRVEAQITGTKQRKKLFGLI